MQRHLRRLALLLGLGIALIHPALDVRSGFLPPARDVDWVWAGALQPASIRVIARLRPRARAHGREPRQQVRLWLSHKRSLAGAAEVVAQAQDPSTRTVSFAAAGLEPGTRYFYALEVDGRLDGARRGTFRTPLAGPQSFTLAFGACAGTGLVHSFVVGGR